jgi:Na+-driven multidrug efflux pump
LTVESGLAAESLMVAAESFGAALAESFAAVIVESFAVESGAVAVAAESAVVLVESIVTASGDGAPAAGAGLEQAAITTPATRRARGAGRMSGSGSLGE